MSSKLPEKMTVRTNMWLLQKWSIYKRGFLGTFTSEVFRHMCDPLFFLRLFTKFVYKSNQFGRSEVNLWPAQLVWPFFPKARFISSKLISPSPFWSIRFMYCLTSFIVIYKLCFLKKCCNSRGWIDPFPSLSIWWNSFSIASSLK